MLTFSSDPQVAEQQMHALIVYLTAFGYIDGEFDTSEKTYIRDYIRKLVEKRAQDALPEGQTLNPEVVDRFVTHFHEVFEQIDNEVRSLFDEAVSDSESVDGFVYAKLKLRAYEIFKSFDKDNQLALLDTAEAVIEADGEVHPAELKFRDEVRALLDVEEISVEFDDGVVDESKVRIESPESRGAAAGNHAFFAPQEEHYSADPIRIQRQTDADRALIERTMAKFDEQRGSGNGLLSGVMKVDDLASKGAFLDGHTYHHPVEDGETYELTVLGDLHGCYSCLKAAVLQSNFFAKLEAYRLDPKNNPNPKLVLLGDYIDRGRFSYNGVLRTVMELFLAAPEHVYVLRGNHEYYLEYNGRIYGGVRPAEAIQTLVGHVPNDMFEAYMKLFEALPNVLLFGKNMFVHAGIPRDADLREKWKDLSSLNDSDLRFQMLWSDPSQTDFIPDDLQAANARFPFGRNQFDAFMQSLGTHTLVRGHEKIVDGFRTVYSGNTTLLNVFSAGGADNDDLPEDSSYRAVTPMALTMLIKGDESTVTPWYIDYKAFNTGETNAFFASQPEIKHKAG